MRQFYKSKTGEEVEAVKIESALQIPALTEVGGRAGVGDFRVYDETRKQWHYMSQLGFEARYPKLGRVVKTDDELDQER